MKRLYRILTILINCLLVVGIFATIYEYIVDGYSNTEESILISTIFLYIVITTSYFIWKTRNISGNTFNSNTIDYVNDNSIGMEPFRFSIFIGISNIIIGTILILLALFIFIVYPIRFNLIDELLRFFVLIFCVLYGGVKLYYSIYVIKKISAKASTPEVE